MKKTLILCFIHGFKGGESTFGKNSRFTEYLVDLVAKQLPKINVRVLVYPRYETRGDLAECVSRFRDWLLEKVIDIEVHAGTPSPTIDASVRTILIGHSMGGIVAAETVIGLTSEHPIEHEDQSPDNDSPDNKDENKKQNDAEKTTGEDQESSSERKTSKSPAPPSSSRPKQEELNSLMFPYIQGVLAFDTPYLGISPGVVAHGAEDHYNTASTAITAFNGIKNTFWGSNSSAGAAAAASSSGAMAALPAASSTSSSAANAAAAAATATGGSGWGKWGTVAMYAGAAGAIAAAGGAAYMKRDQINSGWSWATSHLAFVGCLARGEEMKRRVAKMVRLERELGVGFANLYTRLGAAAGSKRTVVGTVVGGQRTFCNLPAKQAAGTWKEAVNDSAKDEVGAHMAMFEQKQNTGYQKLAEEARDLIVSWSMNDWYEDSREAQAAIEN